MRHMLFAVALLIPSPIWAAFQLSELVGQWTGQGTYTEGVSKAKMRCNLSFVGTDAKVTMSGRCGSSLGAESVVLDFANDADGGVTVRSGAGAPESDSAITGLTGVPGPNGLVVKGSGGDESVIIELLLNANGTLRFATQRNSSNGMAISIVDLSRR